MRDRARDRFARWGLAALLAWAHHCQRVSLGKLGFAPGNARLHPVTRHGPLHKDHHAAFARNTAPAKGNPGYLKLQGHTLFNFRCHHRFWYRFWLVFITKNRLFGPAGFSASPPAPLKADKMADSFLGIDLGGTDVKYGIVDPSGRILRSAKNPTHAERGPEGVLSSIAEHAREIYLQAGRSHAMPPANLTHITDEERRLIVAWFEEAGK